MTNHTHPTRINNDLGCSVFIFFKVVTSKILPIYILCIYIYIFVWGFPSLEIIDKIAPTTQSQCITRGMVFPNLFRTKNAILPTVNQSLGPSQISNLCPGKK
jgi:hypothetical protein